MWRRPRSVGPPTSVRLLQAKARLRWSGSTTASGASRSAPTILKQTLPVLAHRYVFNQLVDTVLAKDRDLVRWGLDHAGTLVPKPRSRNGRVRSCGSAMPERAHAPAMATGAQR
jgi:hypothetical protein